MNETLLKIDKFHKTKFGFAIFGLGEFILSFLFVNLAIDSGNLLDYTLAFVLFIGFVQNIVKLIGMFIHDSKHKAN